MSLSFLFQSGGGTDPADARKNPHNRKSPGQANDTTVIARRAKPDVAIRSLCPMLLFEPGQLSNLVGGVSDPALQGCTLPSPDHSPPRLRRAICSIWSAHIL